MRDKPTTPNASASHTPGPWEYWPAQNYNGFAVAPRGRPPTLASVERCGQLLNVMVHNFPGSTEANARLIAAAPDLLALVEEMAQMAEDDGALFKEDNLFKPFFIVHAEKLRAAIKKARGA